ncbi:MAG: AAA family ATPase [Prevotella sp.]|nr:AAA family ATPase [Prevotella sp.]
MAYQSIIGRNEEIKKLEKFLKSPKSEFVAIYGRRRVGKSYLIEEVYKGKIVFRAIGSYIKDKDSKSYRQTQLDHFYESLLDIGMSDETPRPANWREAFRLLRKCLEKSRAKRRVVFLDELPWLAGPQSAEMITELGYFWNSWADRQRNIVLVVCGSATSWMLDNVIRDYGGLHGRLTGTIRLLPFTLRECEKYFKSRGFHLSRYEMAVAYMAFGGIPYYLDRIDNEKNLSENIDDFFFKEERINQEFKDVYAGLYASSERYVDIVKALGTKFYGMTRSELAEAVGIELGGTFSKILDNLHESGITREYPRYGKERVETVYQLKDFFSMFYLHFIHGKGTDAGNWRTIQRTQTFYTWAGNTFEMLCIEHLPQMKDKLRIATINRNYCWRGQAPDGETCQIDLVLEWKGERTDYICEMKFSEHEFTIDKQYEKYLGNKIEAFLNSKQHTKTHSIQLVMVTTNGISQNIHSKDINQQVTLDDLF